MKYSIIILITLTSWVFLAITPVRSQKPNDYTKILENVRLNKGIRFDFSFDRDYKSFLLNHNQIPKKVQDWIKNPNGRSNVIDIDLMYDPTIGGKVKGEIYELAKIARKVIFNYAFLETTLPPTKTLQKVCQTILGMEKCKNELVVPVINKDKLKSEIATKMRILLNKNYKPIVNPLSRF